eukprot:m51a1_g4930 hypothetical protein (458) ;mRNA; f:264117-266227
MSGSESAVNRMNSEIQPLLDQSSPSSSSSPAGSARQATQARRAQGSFTTIFSVWNTMVGSALLTYPWGFTKSGLAGGVAVVLAMGLATWYTMSLVLRHGRRRTDFIDVCSDVLGRPGRCLAWLGSVLVTFGATVVYNLLVATNAYSLVVGIVETAEHRSDFHDVWYWSPTTAPVVVALALLPLVSLPTFKFAVKISSCGIAGMLYVLGTIIVLAGIKWDAGAQRHYVLQDRFFYLAGITSLSYFVHNFVLQVASNSESPKKALRDVSIGFWMGGLTYATIGGVVYGALGDNVPQNFFDFFAPSYPLVIAGRCALLFQLCSVLPLLCGIIRVQIFGAFVGTERAQQLNVGVRFVSGLVLLVVTTTIAIAFPRVGDVIRFVGAICGLLYLFILPVAVHLVSEWRDNGGSFRGARSAFSVAFHCGLVVLGALVVASQFIPEKAQPAQSSQSSDSAVMSLE